MAGNTEGTMSLAEAAALLGDGVAPHHVQARILRGTLDGIHDGAGDWRVIAACVQRSLEHAPRCGGCGEPVTEMIIVKYPHHDRVEFELCGEHAARTALAYRRQGQVLEVITYPYQSEAWLRPVRFAPESRR